MAHDHVHDRIEKEKWEMPDWMERHFLDYFSGYSKHDVERHVNAGDEVTVFNNAPLALTCVAHKSIVQSLTRLWNGGIFPTPAFKKGDDVMAENRRKSPSEYEEATVINVVTHWDDNDPMLPHHEYTIEFKRLKGQKNRRLTLDESQVQLIKDNDNEAQD